MTISCVEFFIIISHCFKFVSNYLINTNHLTNLYLIFLNFIYLTLIIFLYFTTLQSSSFLYIYYNDLNLDLSYHIIYSIITLLPLLIIIRHRPIIIMNNHILKILLSCISYSLSCIECLKS
jgi:hypothetical protein